MALILDLVIWDGERPYLESLASDAIVLPEVFDGSFEQRLIELVDTLASRAAGGTK